MFSFVHGMQTFPDAIAKRLGERVVMGSDVSSITYERVNGENSDLVFDVRYSSRNGTASAKGDAIVVSVPAYAASTLVKPRLPELAELLSDIQYPPVVEVFLGYRREQISMPLDGFGYLIPEKEGRTILGTIWSSSLFPHRAPPGHVALTTFVGGARQPSLTQLDDGHLRELVSKELHSLMGAQGVPVFSRIIRWDKAIPQYHLGYHRVLEALDRVEMSLPGMFFCSNYRGGISVGDCVMSAEKTAARVCDYLSRRSTTLHTLRKDA
jgi:oxygen-dependent protoporphyrinogen oxidase